MEGPFLTETNCANQSNHISPDFDVAFERLVGRVGLLFFARVEIVALSNHHLYIYYNY